MPTIIKKLYYYYMYVRNINFRFKSETFNKVTITDTKQFSGTRFSIV